MSKIRNVLLAFLAVFIVPMFAACNQQPGGPNYVYASYITLSEESEILSLAMDGTKTYQLQYAVMPAEATNKAVTFTSSNENVVTVDENGLVTAVGVGSAQITIKSTDNDSAQSAVSTVTVRPEKVALNAPYGLTYDGTRISWGTVTTDSGYLPKYQLSIVKDGVAQDVVTTSANSYTNSSALNGVSCIAEGSYSVKVKALGNDTAYNDSVFSPTFEFKQLSAPTELKVEYGGDLSEGERTFNLTFKLSSNTTSISDYEYRITPTAGSAISAEQQALWDTALLNSTVSNGVLSANIPSELSETPVLIVFKAKANTSTDIWGSQYSESITVGKLSAPKNLNVVVSGSGATQKNILTWSSVPTATQYKIKVDYLVNDDVVQTCTDLISAAGVTSYDLSNLTGVPSTYDAYEVYMYAIGSQVNTSYFVDSVSSSRAQKQLAIPAGEMVISADSENQQYIIEWQKVTNAQSYNIYISNNNSSVISESDGKPVKNVEAINPTKTTIAYDEKNGEKLVWNIGDNYIKIVAIAEAGTSYSDSGVKVSVQKLIKLATPAGFTVSYGQLKWEPVENATHYIVDFGNGEQVQIAHEANKSSYTYEPTIADFGGETYLNVNVYAINDADQNIIQSQPTERIQISMYDAIGQAYISVVDGELTWEVKNANGDRIGTDYVEVMITNTNTGSQVVEPFKATGSINIAEKLNEANASERLYTFKLRPINNMASGTFVINGKYSEAVAINTYQMSAPESLRIEEGVIKWQKYADTNIADNHPGIRYVLKVGSVEYTEVNGEEFGINVESAVLDSLTSNSRYSISIQTKIDTDASGQQFGTTILGSDTTYIINSPYSQTITAKVLTKPYDVSVRGNTLSWKSTSTSINRYQIYLYQLDENDKPTTLLGTEKVSFEQGLTNLSVDFSATSFADQIVLAGNYQFMVMALGDNGTDDASITSEISNAVEICKLATPVLRVEAGKITWAKVFMSLDGETETPVDMYKLIVTNSNGATKEYLLNTNETSLDELSLLGEDSWCGENNTLSFTIQALSNGKNRVYDSAVSSPYVKNATELDNVYSVVYKLQKIDISEVNVEDDVIEWTQSTEPRATYTIELYQTGITGTSKLSTIDVGTNNYYTMPDGWASGNYYIKIKRNGYEANYIIEGSGTENERQKSVKALSSVYSESIDLMRFAEPAGLRASVDENNDPRILWSVAQDNSNARFKVTVAKLSDEGTVEESNTLTYFVDYDASLNGQYSLDLYKVADDNGKYLYELGAGNYQYFIQSVAKLNEGNPITSVTQNGKTYILMDSKTTTKRGMTIYSAPSITVDGSSIVIENSNNSNMGTKLVFTPLEETASGWGVSGTPIEVRLTGSQTVYEVDITKFGAGTYYQVETMALGNSSNYVHSSMVLSDLIISKLNVLQANTVTANLQDGVATNTEEFNGWYIVDGDLRWNKVSGAQSYNVIMSNEEISREVLSRENDANQFSETIMDMGFANSYGAFSLQFELVGGVSADKLTLNGQELNIAYLNSELSDAVYVNKLFAPNYNLVSSYEVKDVLGGSSVKSINRAGAYARIENGEFDFGIRDGGVWADDTGATAYKLMITSSSGHIIETDVYTLNGTEQRFIASNLFSETGDYTVTMYSLGNTWYGTNDSTQTIYLTSDTHSYFILKYIGVVDDLQVANGQLAWDLTEAGMVGYGLYYKSGDITDTINLTSNTYAFDNVETIKGKVIDEVKVRFAGSDTIDGAVEGFVNTAWTDTPMRNICKLPDISKTNVGGRDSDLYINETGQLAWTVGDNFDSLGLGLLKFNIAHSVRIGDVTVQETTSEAVSLAQGAYDVPPVVNNTNSSTEQNIYTFDISAYVMGSIDGALAGQNSETLYLNSDSYQMSASKLNTPAQGTFKLDTVNGPGMRIEWDLTGCRVSPDIKADRILITYNLNGSAQRYSYKVNTMDYSTEKGIYITGGMPLWQLGTYTNVRLSVLNSQGLAFGSAAIAMTPDAVEFNHFESGSGTRNDPFVISTEEQLSMMYWMPDVYFKLKNDIILPDLSVLQQSNPDVKTNMPYPAGLFDYDNVNVKYYALALTGGIDGNGFKISNYQVVGDKRYGMWSTLIGSDLQPLKLSNGTTYTDTIFKDKGGIITNLTIEVNTINLDGIEVMHNGIFAGKNYGILYNCHTKGDNNKLGENSERLSVFEGYLQVDEENIVSTFAFGGLVGLNAYNILEGEKLADTQDGEIFESIPLYQGRIENCTNMLDMTILGYNTNLENSCLGGIAGVNQAGMIINCTNGEFDANTQLNSGKLSGYIVGGIAGRMEGINTYEPTTESFTSVMYYAYVTGCTNYGVINSKRIIDANSNTATGGIAGDVSNGYITYCINYGKVTTDGKAAILGGIAGMLNEGGYVISNIDMGTIEYDETKSVVRYGALVGYMSNGALFNSIFQRDSIIITTATGITTNTLYATYYNGYSGDYSDYTSISALSVEEFNNTNVNIIELTIAAAGATITTVFADINGNYAQFTKEAGQNPVITWTGLN